MSKPLKLIIQEAAYTKSAKRDERCQGDHPGGNIAPYAAFIVPEANIGDSK
ncbi:hypothetical protein D3C73_1483120 [compost metagenome]